MTLSQPTRLRIIIGTILVVWVLETYLAIKVSEAQPPFPSSFKELFSSSLISGAITIALVFALLSFGQENLASIRFVSAKRLKHQVLFGLILGIVMMALANFVIGPLARGLFGQNASAGVSLSDYFSSYAYLPLWMIIALFKGGFAEELWRVFTLAKFEKVGGKIGLTIGFLASSLVFAMGHYYQGIDGIVASGIGGMIYASVYIWRRSALEVMIAHGFRDVISILLGYVIYS